MAESEQIENIQIERSPRRNMLLSAEIETHDSVCRVVLRNVSETGVLAEGSGLPETGETLILRKGGFEITGTVAWALGTRCGIRFDSPIDIRALAEGAGRAVKPTAQGPSHQLRVDAIQTAIRRGTLIEQRSAEPALRAARPTAIVDRRLAEELHYVQRLLETLGDALTSDPLVINRHAAALQSLDLANQLLGHVAGIVVATDREGAIAAIGSQDVRARLSRG